MPIARPSPGSYVTPDPATYSTTWPNTEDPISYAGAWRTPVNFYQHHRSTPGKLFAAANSDNFDDAVSQLVSPNMGDNYRISAHVFRQGGYTPGGSHEIGLYCRVLIDNSNPSNTLIRGYEFLFPFNSGVFQIVAWLGVDHGFPSNFNILSPTTQNGGLQPIANGDLIEAQISGNSLSAYQNGVLIATLTDTTWTSGGGPGMGSYVNTGGTPSSFCITDYTVQRL